MTKAVSLLLFIFAISLAGLAAPLIGLSRICLDLARKVKNERN